MAIMITIECSDCGKSKDFRGANFDKIEEKVEKAGWQNGGHKDGMPKIVRHGYCKKCYEDESVWG